MVVGQPAFLFLVESRRVASSRVESSRVASASVDGTPSMIIHAVGNTKSSFTRVFVVYFLMN
jgi:hypothetical protein